MLAPRALILPQSPQRVAARSRAAASCSLAWRRSLVIKPMTVGGQRGIRDRHGLRSKPIGRSLGAMAANARVSPPLQVGAARASLGHRSSRMHRSLFPLAQLVWRSESLSLDATRILRRVQIANEPESLAALAVSRRNDRCLLATNRSVVRACQPHGQIASLRHRRLVHMLR